MVASAAMPSIAAEPPTLKPLGVAMNDSWPSLSTCPWIGAVLPNCLSPIIVQATFIFAYAILAEAILSFLGVGPPPPTPTWGNMIAEGKDYLREAPHLWLFATLGTALSMLQLLIYSVLARRGSRSSWLLWGALLFVVLLGRSADSPMELILMVIGVDAVVLAALLTMSWSVVRKPSAQDTTTGSATLG